MKVLFCAVSIALVAVDAVDTGASIWDDLIALNAVYDCCPNHPDYADLSHLNAELDAHCKAYSNNPQAEADCRNGFLQDNMVPWAQQNCREECLNPGMCAGHWPNLDKSLCVNDQPHCPDGTIPPAPDLNVIGVDGIPGKNEGSIGGGITARSITEDMESRRLQGTNRSSRRLQQSLLGKTAGSTQCPKGHHLLWRACKPCATTCPPPMPPSIYVQKYCNVPVGCAEPIAPDGMPMCSPGTTWDTTLCHCAGDCPEGGSTPAPPVCNGKPIDIGFVIDSSNSINAANFAKMKHEIGKILDGLEIAPDKIQVAAHAFSCSNCHTHTDAGFGLMQHYGASNVEAAIDALPHHQSSTYTGTALQYTLEKVMTPSAGLRDNGGNAPAIIIITDGKPTGNQVNVAAEQAALARAAGFRIFSIGVGGTYNLPNLHAMASTPFNDYVYELDNFEISVFKQKLLSVVCS